MDKVKLESYRRMIWLVGGILLFEILILCLKIRPQGFLLWATIFFIAVMGVYLIRISLTLLKELGKNLNNKNEKPEL